MATLPNREIDMFVEYRSLNEALYNIVPQYIQIKGTCKFQFSEEYMALYNRGTDYVAMIIISSKSPLYTVAPEFVRERLITERSDTTQGWYNKPQPTFAELTVKEMYKFQALHGTNDEAGLSNVLEML